MFNNLASTQVAIVTRFLQKGRGPNVDPNALRFKGPKKKMAPPFFRNKCGFVVVLCHILFTSSESTPVYSWGGFLPKVVPRGTCAC